MLQIHYKLWTFFKCAFKYQSACCSVHVTKKIIVLGCTQLQCHYFIFPPPDSPRREIYFLALVDILSHYASRKRTATIGSVQPGEYARRLIDFLSKAMLWWLRPYTHFLLVVTHFQEIQIFPSFLFSLRYQRCHLVTILFVIFNAKWSLLTKY